MAMYNLTASVPEYTRITANSAKRIDNVLVRLQCSYTTKVVETGLSDHLAQIINIKHVNTQKVYAEKLFLHTKIMLGFNNLCCRLIGPVFLGDVSVDGAYNQCIEIFNDCFQLAFSKKLRLITNEDTHTGWIARGIRISSKNKRFLKCGKTFRN